MATCCMSRCLAHECSRFPSFLAASKMKKERLKFSQGTPNFNSIWNGRTGGQVHKAFLHFKIALYTLSMTSQIKTTNKMPSCSSVGKNYLLSPFNLKIKLIRSVNVKN